MAIRILIVDDHSVVRQGLQMFLRLDDELDVVGEARHGIEAVKQAQRLRPDVVLMDILMPKNAGCAIGRCRWQPGRADRSGATPASRLEL